MLLYLVRHAIAYDADQQRWPDDRDRPLTNAGEKRFRAAARGLGVLVPSVDTLLSSPYRRAWRTAELLEQEAGWPKPIESAALEAGRAPAEVMQALQAYDPQATVALVGHEPTLHELTSYLLTADARHAEVVFRKGGVARLQLDDDLRAGSAQLDWLLAPKILRAIA